MPPRNWKKAGRTEKSASHNAGQTAVFGVKSSDLAKAEKFKKAGNKAFVKKEYDAAIVQFSKAIALNPNDHVFYSNRSACYAHKEEYLKAIHDAQQCVDLKPDFVKGYARLGVAHFNLRQYSKAKAAYGAGLALDSEHSALSDGLEQVRLAEEKEVEEGKIIDPNAAPQASFDEDPVIGIDLGTTFSCVSVWMDGKPVVLENTHGAKTTPSWVAFTDEGRVVGQPAKDQASRRPKHTLSNIKRLIGRQIGDCSQDIKHLSFHVKEGKNGKPMVVVPQTKVSVNKTYAPEQISAMVLEEMKKVAEIALGKPVRRAVVTVPAYFNDSQRRLTKDAGTIAGLDVLRIINEPTAAALAYGLHKKGTQHVLVFDLGGGTFDVSLLKIDNGLFEVLATAGDTHLGGEDFDIALSEWAIAKLTKQQGEDCKEKEKAEHLFGQGQSGNLRRLRAACETAKISLSVQEVAHIDLFIGEQEISISCTLDEFNKVNEQHFQRCLTSVKKVMSDAKVEKSVVDEVVLVGGSTRCLRVREILSEYFGGKELCQNVNPDEAVAYGAAIQAAILGGVEDPLTQGILLVDVVPLSLGVEMVGKKFAKVVPRNTSIPCKRTSEFTTVEDYQTAIDMRVFEGERTHTDGNHLLGEFSIQGIERAKKGEAKIEVTFEVNTNGLLLVSARDRVTGAHANVEIDHDRGRLSNDEIQSMVTEAEELSAIDAELLKADGYVEEGLESKN